jgi:DNA repair protein RadA/Sms
MYVSGEESGRQLKMRQSGLNAAGEGLYILVETALSEILKAVEELAPEYTYRRFHTDYL